MLFRCVLSTVCVVLMAPVVPAGARSSDNPSSAVTLHGTSARPPDAMTVQGPGTEVLTGPEPRITLEASGVITVQTPGDGNVQAPMVVVLESPKITCPMVMVTADPKVDPKFVTQLPKDITFTIRSVAPPACR